MRTIRELSFLLLLLSALARETRSEDHVLGWGRNLAGQATGVPSERSSENVTGVVVLSRQVVSNVVAIAAGDAHSLALRRDGTVLGWGYNYYAQATGSPTKLSTAGVVRIKGAVLTNVVGIAAGWRHSLALKRDGTVVGWGDDAQGQASAPSGLSNVVSIAAGYARSLALKADGRVVAWGTPDAKVPAGLSNVVAIAIGGAQNARNLALKADGTVVAWGAETDDAPPPPGLSNVIAIAVGERHSLALKQDGTVFGWGLNSYGETTGVPSRSMRDVASGLVQVNGRVLSNVVAIAAGNAYGLVGLGEPYSLALKQDGTVVAWGHMAGRPAWVPAGLSNVVAIAAGQLHCLAIQSDEFPATAPHRPSSAR